MFAMRRRDLALHLVGASAAFSGLMGGSPARAAATEGREYQLVRPPQPVAASGKIEVIEFFGYWCPHCNELEPSLEAWVAKLPADVNFRRMPVAFRPADETLQRLYFALEALGWVEKAHAKVFAAMHVQRMAIRNDDQAADFAKAQGLDAAKLVDTMKGFSVATKVRQANQAAQNYKLDAVPTLYVQGRYKTDVGSAGGPVGMFAVLDELIAKVRKG
jgi:thiol:disulfide interchange protein DsbA